MKVISITCHRARNRILRWLWLPLALKASEKLPAINRSTLFYLSKSLAAVHALALHTYTEKEWQQRHGQVPMSPPCLGGSQSEKS